MIYEFITPSDPITFIANDDKIAYFCSVVLGNAKAGCENKDTGESLGTILIFCPNATEYIKEFLGCDLESFPKLHKKEVVECFKSFSYGSVQDRKTYDSAIKAITEPDKLADFKKNHEDENRTSMSQWVKSAWNYAEAINKMEAN